MEDDDEEKHRQVGENELRGDVHSRYPEKIKQMAARDLGMIVR